MFADRLLETVWAQGSRRGWMTLTWSRLQALAAAFLLLRPLMGTTALPQLRPLSPPASVAPPPGPHPTPSHLQSTAISPGKMLGNVLLAPRRIAIAVQNVADDAAPPQLGASGPYVPGSTGSGDTNEVLKLDWHRSETRTTSSTTASSQGTTIAYEGGRSHLQSKAPVPFARAKRTHSRIGSARSRDQPARQDRKPAGPYWPSHVGSRGHRCGHPMALSFLRPQRRTRRGRDANHGELFSLRRLERDRRSVTPIFKARIVRE
jgi:hypothetical protein